MQVKDWRRRIQSRIFDARTLLLCCVQYMCTCLYMYQVQIFVDFAPGAHLAVVYVRGWSVSVDGRGVVEGGVHSERELGKVAR